MWKFRATVGSPMPEFEDVECSQSERRALVLRRLRELRSFDIWDLHASFSLEAAMGERLVLVSAGFWRFVDDRRYHDEENDPQIAINVESHQAASALPLSRPMTKAAVVDLLCTMPAYLPAIRFEIRSRSNRQTVEWPLPGRDEQVQSAPPAKHLVRYGGKAIREVREQLRWLHTHDYDHFRP